MRARQARGSRRGHMMRREQVAWAIADDISRFSLASTLSESAHNSMRAQHTPPTGTYHIKQGREITQPLNIGLGTKDEPYLEGINIARIHSTESDNTKLTTASKTNTKCHAFFSYCTIRSDWTTAD
jgi:hypothetical protein